MINLLWQAFLETLLMVSFSSIFSIILGGGLGVLLWTYGPTGLHSHTGLYRSFSFLVNAVRSIPYIILIVLMIPVTRLLVGTSIGTFAAIIPLTVAGLLLIARGVEEALKALPPQLLEVGLSCGATPGKIILRILLPEAMPQIVAAVTLVVINIIGFSAMAGAVGGGGLGDLAIRYGYQRYEVGLLFGIVVILIILVQLIQIVGDAWGTRLRKDR